MHELYFIVPLYKKHKNIKERLSNSISLSNIKTIKKLKIRKCRIKKSFVYHIITVLNCTELLKCMTIFPQNHSNIKHFLQEKVQKKDGHGDVSSFSSGSGVTLDGPLKVLSVAKKEGESY